jgi:hypothetical protein
VPETESNHSHSALRTAHRRHSTPLGARWLDRADRASRAGRQGAVREELGPRDDEMTRVGTRTRASATYFGSSRHASMPGLRFLRSENTPSSHFFVACTGLPNASKRKDSARTESSQRRHRLPTTLGAATATGSGTGGSTGANCNNIGSCCTPGVSVGGWAASPRCRSDRRHVRPLPLTLPRAGPSPAVLGKKQ